MVLVIRRMIVLPNQSGNIRLPQETVTSCQHCHRSDGFIIGPYDYTDQIRERTMYPPLFALYLFVTNYRS